MKDLRPITRVWWVKAPLRGGSSVALTLASHSLLFVRVGVPDTDEGCEVYVIEKVDEGPAGRNPNGVRICHGNHPIPFNKSLLLEPNLSS